MVAPAASAPATRPLTALLASLRSFGAWLPIGVAAAAFVIFSFLFTFALPFIELGWSLRQSGGLLLLTWTLGGLFAAPMVFFGGMLAGATLYLFGKIIGE